ncbi:MAG TPA: spore germination protein GerW family protein [Candidatus Limnocylindrales bacterium]|nr:spore germination protein GerW family protein [Candidatus Limnocylindrales bacterium]
MKVEELMEQARDTITVKRVFGEPYVKNGTTVIPVASVMGGAGGGEGGGPMPMPGVEGEAGSSPAMATGMGAGFGVRATPAGAYVIHGDEVVWQPAIDVTRIEVMNRALAIVGLLVVGSILRALLRR